MFKKLKQKVEDGMANSPIKPPGFQSPQTPVSNNFN